MSIFAEVRERVSIADAISYLGLKATETKGEQLRFPCPKCGGDNRVLSVNLSRGFRCFGSDKKGDDATALVSHVLGIRNGEAAQKLKERFISSGPSTKPERATAKAEGRGSDSDVVSPLEILGISDELADRLHIQVEDGRVLFEQRDERGIKCGTLALATRDDLPLVEFIQETLADAPQANNIHGLWRLVKGRA